MLKVFLLIFFIVELKAQQVPGACFCVTQGSCNNNNNNNNGNNNGGNNGNNNQDGSGNIDIRSNTRIQTNGQNANMGSGGTSLVLTTPASSGLNYVVNNQQSCMNGLERCCPTNGYQCGIRYPSPFGSRAPVPGSGQSEYGEYPWVAVIITPEGVFQGAGVLIDHLHVLTGAHKVNNSFNSNYLVELGEWDGTSSSEVIPMQVIQVVRIFIHQQFNSANLRNNVAILRLAQAVNLGSTPTVTPACLPSSQIPMNSLRCWVAGWGVSQFQGNFNSVQREVDLPLVDQFQCQTMLRNTRLGPTFILDTQSFICAGGESGRDACTGDGGSPLVCNIANQWYAIGLVAWGIGCGGYNVPGVYVNVANYVSWIQQTTRSG